MTQSVVGVGSDSITGKDVFLAEVRKMRVFRRLAVPDQCFYAPFSQMLTAAFTQQVSWMHGRLPPRAKKQWLPGVIIAWMERWRNHARGWPACLFLGTAREEALSTESAELIRALTLGMVELHCACCNGWGDQGVMGAASRAMVDAWKGDFNIALQAPLIAVPLMFQPQPDGLKKELPFCASRYAPDVAWLQDKSQLRQVQIVSPSKASIGPRTGNLFLGPENLVALAFEGGVGTLEEIASFWLNWQLAHHIVGPFSHLPKDCFPQMILCDRWIPESGCWLYDPKIQDVALRIQTRAIDPNHVEAFQVVRVGSGRPSSYPAPPDGMKVSYFATGWDAALYILAQASKTYSALCRFYERAEDTV